MSLELDAATADAVAHLARTWGVSREEAVVRAVKQADTGASSDKQGRLQALRKLQDRLELTPAKATEWQNLAHEARR
jgi:hypothetical protein